MTYRPYYPSAVFVEKSILAHSRTQKILGRLGNREPILLDSLHELTRGQRNRLAEQSNSSRPLVLAHQKSDFLKRCPGTQNYICCGYHILNLVNNCEIGCSYCILQGYLNNPFIVIYVNIEDMFAELEQRLTSHSNRVYRIGTGELADSLSTDHFTEYSHELVTFFSDKKNAVIELKTKTTQIENFINCNHRGQTVVAWSLNTPKVIATEEPWAPSLEERLAAAAQCKDAGFKLAFHFDPMIVYDNWETEYPFVVEKIFETIKPENIIWISLGALRYPSHLDQIIRQNHPDTKIVYGELIPGKDGKLRYFKPLRIEMFGKMYRWIKNFAPDLFVYLCMESSEVWQRAFGWSPGTSAGLKKKMDKLIRAG